VYNPPIGKGAFGVVNRAKYKGIIVAVKTFTDDEATADFAKEVRILAQLSHHPNIVLLVVRALIHSKIISFIY
jgi:serine/threonine protein kinase